MIHTTNELLNSLILHKRQTLFNILAFSQFSPKKTSKSQCKMPGIEAEILPADIDPEDNHATLSGAIVGIIYPPPEVRSKHNLKNYFFLKRF